MGKSRSSADRLGPIATFVCVGESASFTDAAKKLQMTVSGVSRAISRLEERLQVRLLNRTARSTSLTDEGSCYFERCKQVLLDLERAESEIANSKSQPRGRLRLLLPRALGRQVVLPGLVSFHEQYPEVHVDAILDGRSLNLEEEGIDIALRYGVPANSPLVGRRLCPVFYLACASPNYLRKYGPPRSISDLDRHRLIGQVIAQDGRCRPWHFDENGTTRSVTIASAININDMSAVADAAANGAGIAYLADFLAADYLRSGSLIVVLNEFIFEGVPIYLAHPRRRHIPARLRVLRDFLRRLLPSTTPWGEIALAQKSGHPKVQMS